jgi:phosphoglycerol transferase MdoB-like AlkP superfamily enzyme
LIGKSLVFENGFANGHRSIEGIPAVVASIPTLMYEPYTTSRYAGNTVTSLANVLGPEGYQTSFMHGGNTNSMNFESFARQAGYATFYNRNSYPFPDRDYDGYWGIFDHLFLQQCVKEFSETQQPFFSSIFTLSSHYPYALPKEYKNTFPKGSLPIHENVGYADEALRQFFASASKTDWYNSTLFVITADHTSLSEHPQFQTKVGSLRIPIILFHPNDSTLIGRQPQIVQQIDIQPTILDLLGYDKPFFSLGVSAFNSEPDHFVIAFKNDQHQLLLNERLIGFDGENVRFNYVLKGEQLYKVETGSESDENEKFMKAYLQNYSRALLGNKMTFEAWED